MRDEKFFNMPMLYGAATGDGDSCYWYCTVQYIRCEGKYLGPGLCPAADQE